MTEISRHPAQIRNRKGMAAVVFLCLVPFSAIAADAPATPLSETPAAPQSEAAKARAAILAAKNNIDVGEGWVRASGADKTAAVYMTISSAKDQDKLIGIDAPIADSAELRDTVTENGASKTVFVETLDIPGGATVNLRPGGRHLVLNGLKAPLAEGEAFLITFRFDKAGFQTLPVKVLSTSANGLPPIGSTRQGDTTAAVTQR
jgi:copper(I)-binding protein